ncbi:MAG: hypothetical protein RSD87_02455 [Cellulosilyticaceae bacterium]
MDITALFMTMSQQNVGLQVGIAVTKLSYHLSELVILLQQKKSIII